VPLILSKLVVQVGRDTKFSTKAAKIAKSLKLPSVAALLKDLTFLTLNTWVVTSFLAWRQYSPYGAKATSDEHYFKL
jgi:hypothetical protein